MSVKNHVIIGIGGATNSGKSSVSSMLCKILPRSKWIRQDDYFLEPDDQNVEIKDGYRNWDTLSALNMNRMVEDVEQWIRQQQNNTEMHILIIEGFLIYNHSKLASLIDKKYFIEITKEISKDRRKYRVYNPPDTPGYFDKIVWTSYLKHFSELKSQDNIEYIDGQTDLDTLRQTILSKIQAVLDKSPVKEVIL